ncbi:MAG TPA: hypothetical protein VGH23_16230 [Rhizomicrobium sp.]
MKVSLKGSASPFAHLFGRSASASKSKAEDKKEKDKDEERAAAEGEDDKEKDDKKAKKAKAKKAEGEDDDESVEAEGDDEEEDEEREQAAYARGEAAECSRWVVTLSNLAATNKGESAIHMLATTRLTSEQIAGVLGGLPAGDAKANRRSLDSRMQDLQQHNPGAGDGQQQDSPDATAKTMMAVYDRVSGKSAK